MRCPICGAPGFWDMYRSVWLCRCAGPVIAFGKPCPLDTRPYDPVLEDCRRIMVHRGFGWSWFNPAYSPIFNRGED